MTKLSFFKQLEQPDYRPKVSKVHQPNHWHKPGYWFWADERGNMMPLSRAKTEAQAEQIFATLRNCYKCFDCRDCSFCYKCNNCIDCHNCRDCRDCRGCYRCRLCNLCNECHQCFLCKKCNYCKKCNMCKRSGTLTLCDYCSYCHNCTDVRHSWYCNHCIGCRVSTHLYGCEQSRCCYDCSYIKGYVMLKGVHLEQKIVTYASKRAYMIALKTMLKSDLRSKIQRYLSRPL